MNSARSYLTPRGLHDAALAIAGSRAGAIGILDLGSDTTAERARHAFADLLRLGRGELGLRLEFGVDELSACDLLAQLPEGSSVVLAAPAGVSQGAWGSSIHAFARSRGLRIFAEVCSALEAQAAAASDVDALIANGSESGGRTGDATTFVLVQELLERFALPVWARGGIDTHTAAACAAGGAAGVVLCEELALVRESTLPEAVRDAISGMDGGETVVLGSELGQSFRFFKRAGCAGADELKARHDAAFTAADPAAWESFLQSAASVSDGPIGWKSHQAWPIGQNGCFAAGLARRFHTTGGVVAGIAAAVGEHLRLAAQHEPTRDRFVARAISRHRVPDRAGSDDARLGRGAVCRRGR